MWFAQETAVPTLYDSTETLDAVVVATNGNTNEGVLAAFGIYMLFALVLNVLAIVAMWRVFDKADEAGWKSIIPFYNVYTLFRIAGRNGWWFLGLFVPLFNIYVSIMFSIDLAKHFGKSTTFGVVGLWLFSLIGLFILGYGDAKYEGPKHA